VADDPRLLNIAFDLLQPLEKQRSAKYHHHHDQHRFITARAGLRLLLAKYLHQDPTQIELTIGINKKPSLTGTAGPILQYNTAHSGNWIVMAFGALEVGIDLEKVKPDFDYRAVLDITCGVEEIQFVESAADPRLTFYLLWTRKEALVKATAKGLHDELKALPTLNGTREVKESILGSADDWVVNSFAMDEDYVGSLAYRPSTKTIRFYDSTRTLAMTL
jgi:4'-phosphopantetheinyl transferase